MQLRHKYKLLSSYIRETFSIERLRVARQTLLSKDGFELLLITLLIISIPYSIRFVFDTPYNTILGTYSDFTAISLYFLDFIVVAFIAFSIKQKRFSKILLIPCFLLLYLVISTIVSRENNTIALYFGVRNITSLIFGIYISLSPVLQKYWRYLSGLIILLGVSQVGIQIIQFSFQHSLGLQLIGESSLDLSTYGVAKFVTHGTTILRGYGTFPHPNTLAAFLVIISLLNLYLFTITYQVRNKLTLGFCYYILVIGIALTFSRAGVLALVISTITYGVGLVIRQIEWNKIRDMAIMVGSSWVIVFLLFQPLYGSRANLNDSATAERNIYNRAGISMISENPIIGVGQQGNVLHMEQYSSEQLQPWLIQPIHNYYLLWIADWGIAGWGIIAIFVFILMKILKNLFLPRGEDIFSTWLLPILGSILLLFLVDHYFYTIFPMQILLWGIIGVIIQHINNNRVLHGKHHL